MKITETFEHIRSIYAPDNGSAFCTKAILSNERIVDYGSSIWSSRSYWIVPNTIDVE